MRYRVKENIVRITYRKNRNSYNRSQVITLFMDNPFDAIKEVISRFPNCKVLKVETFDPISETLVDAGLEE